MSSISVLNCSMKNQEYFLLQIVLPKLEISRNRSIHFEMFLLNSKFHEIHQLGGYFYLQGWRGEGNELHLGSKLFHEESRILSGLKCSS